MNPDRRRNQYGVRHTIACKFYDNLAVAEKQEANHKAVPLPIYRVQGRYENEPRTRPHFYRCLATCSHSTYLPLPMLKRHLQMLLKWIAGISIEFQCHLTSRRLQQLHAFFREGYFSALLRDIWDLPVSSLERRSLLKPRLHGCDEWPKKINYKNVTDSGVVVGMSKSSVLIAHITTIAAENM